MIFSRHFTGWKHAYLDHAPPQPAVLVVGVEGLELGNLQERLS